jgi:hypothetical protein
METLSSHLKEQSKILSVLFKNLSIEDYALVLKLCEVSEAIGEF